jgi:enoyl-CoA hydratase/carnithine racemase
MTEQSLVVEGPIARLRLQRPEKRNALTRTMVSGMRSALVAAAGSATLRALVLEGDGPSFCAGVDLHESKDAEVEFPEPFPTVFEKLLDDIRSFPAPTLAKIHGACIGAGCALALTCDVRFASRDAVFAIPVVRHGLRYPTSEVHRLTELIGPGHASQFLFSSCSLDAAQAAAWGLVDTCSDDLDAATQHYLDAILSGDADSLLFCRDQIRSARHRISGATDERA